MARNFYLDDILPGESEFIDEKKTTPDYGKILNRVFRRDAFQLKSESGVKRANSEDNILLNSGMKYQFATRVVQQPNSPRFLGVPSSEEEMDENFENTYVYLEIKDRTEPALHFKRATVMRRIHVIDREVSTSRCEILSFTGAEVGTNLSVTSGTYSPECPVIHCQQPELIVTNSNFSGEGVAVRVSGICRKVAYNFNLNHSDARALEVLSPECLIEMKYNTIDIGSQLLWQRGRMLNGSVISYNSCQNHRPDMLDGNEDGHFIFIQGNIDGLEISHNSLSGADGIDGDTSNPSQTDECQFDRPDSHIKIKAQRIVQLKIIKNQLRYPRLAAISLTGAIEDSRIEFNNFSGIDNLNATTSGIACLLEGSLPITRSSFSFNMLDSKDKKTVDMFGFSGRTLEDCRVRANCVSTPGETYNGIGSLKGTCIIKRNFERDI